METQRRSVVTAWWVLYGLAPTPLPIAVGSFLDGGLASGSLESLAEAIDECVTFAVVTAWWSPPRSCGSSSCASSRPATSADERALRPCLIRSIYLVRHAKAGERRMWTGDDLDRPLSKAGWKQANALGKRLAKKARR